MQPQSFTSLLPSSPRLTEPQYRPHAAEVRQRQQHQGWRRTLQHKDITATITISLTMMCGSAVSQEQLQNMNQTGQALKRSLQFKRCDFKTHLCPHGKAEWRMIYVLQDEYTPLWTQDLPRNIHAHDTWGLAYPLCTLASCWEIIKRHWSITEYFKNWSFSFLNVIGTWITVLCEGLNLWKIEYSMMIYCQL